MALTTRVSVAATASNVLLCAASNHRPTVVAVQISGTLTSVSITFVGRLTTNKNLTNSDNQALSYTTPASNTLAATAVTAAGIFYFTLNGVDLYANVTVTTGGPVNFDVIPLSVA